MTENHWYIVEWAAVVLGLASLAGCATNGITVSETTPDGGTLTVEQRTMSTWGSRTAEGDGSFAYSAEPAGGFDMRAGANVLDQQSGDPSELIAAIIRAAVPLLETMAAQSGGNDDDSNSGTGRDPGDSRAVERVSP